MAIALPRRISNAALPVCLAGMDGCWIYIVASLISANVLIRIAFIPVPSPVALAALELAAWWLASRLLDHTNLPMPVVQALSGVAGLLAAILVAFVTNPPTGDIGRWAQVSIYGIITGLVLWFLGGYRASARAGFTQAYNNFRIGLFAIAAMGILTAILAGSSSEYIWASLGGATLWFFAWSLGALALGNRQVVREEFGETRSGAWGPALITSIVIILIVGAIAGAFGGQNLIDTVEKLVQGVLLLVGTLLYAVIYGLLWGLSLIKIGPLAIKQKTPNDPDENVFTPGKTFNPGDNSPFSIPAEYQTLFIWVGAALMALVAIWLITRGLRRTRRGMEDSPAEERESLGSWGLLWMQFKAWLDALMARFRPASATQTGADEDDLAALMGRPEWSGTLTVRQIYSHLQSLAGKMGHPRAPQQTPVEYLSVLSSFMPQLRPDFMDITAAYLEARYGPLPASAPAVMSANNAWKRAEPALKAAAAGQGR